MRKRPWIRIAASLLVFAAIGTAGLMWLFNVEFQRLSHKEFIDLARANADFVRALRLPPSERLAAYLSQLQGVDVRLVAAPDNLPGRETATATVAPGFDLSLIRATPRLLDVLLRPTALATLAVFWTMWFGLAWAVLVPSIKAQRLAALGSIATSLAHEIRNPISSIRLHGQLLEEGKSPGATLIVEEAARIEDMVNQWMFLARPCPPLKTPVAVKHILGEAARLLAPAAGHARVELIIDADEAWQIEADNRRLRQAFHNIILNAIQAMPAGGKLTICARDGVISFSDTGPGFSPTALRRWAEMLYSEKEGGMGIGLSVAREIVLAHGGRLAAVNQTSGGALVQVTL